MALTPKLWSLSALAVELGCNIRTVSAALANTPPDGTIEGGHKGWFLLTALEALGARLPVRGHRLSKLHGGANGQASADDAYYESRTMLACERAKLLQMQRREAEGELLPISILASELKNMALFLRGRALALPSKCAPRLVMMRTAGQAQAVLDAEIRDWLLDLASTKIRSHRRKRPAPDWEDWVEDTGRTQ
jgi:hypothetical protein